jgi:D-arabinose 1-dehydrogenase-like Zn-dependent alcohol dehydrogenase
MRSHKLTRFGAPRSKVIESPPAPKETQVLLRVSACGVCHSDLDVADGYIDLGQGQKLDLARTVKLPRILGHEIVGIVEELALPLATLPMRGVSLIGSFAGTLPEFRELIALAAKAKSSAASRDSAARDSAAITRRSTPVTSAAALS